MTKHSELSLRDWQERPYGWFAKGYVEDVPVRIRSPQSSLEDVSLPKVVNFNGLTAGHHSMAVPARAAVGLGYAAVTFDYTNKSISKVLDKNADDGLRILDALPEGDTRLMGLSMGGAISTLVAARADRPIDALHLVAPGAYTHDIDKVTKLRLARALAQEFFDEAEVMLRNPFLVSAIARDSLRNCILRAVAVPAELHELIYRTVYSELEEFRGNQPETTVVLAHGSRDSLVPREPLLESVAKQQAQIGKPLIDTELPYHGKHIRVAEDEHLAESILKAASPSVVAA